MASKLDRYVHPAIVWCIIRFVPRLAQGLQRIVDSSKLAWPASIAEFHAYLSARCPRLDFCVIDHSWDRDDKVVTYRLKRYLTDLQVELICRLEPLNQLEQQWTLESHDRAWKRTNVGEAVDAVILYHTAFVLAHKGDPDAFCDRRAMRERRNGSLRV